MVGVTKTIKVGNYRYVHITNEQILKEKANTIKQRLLRNQISDLEAIDPKTKRGAIKLAEGWWLKVKDEKDGK